MRTAVLCSIILVLLAFESSRSSAQSDSGTLELSINSCIYWSFPTTVTEVYAGNSYSSSESGEVCVLDTNLKFLYRSTVAIFPPSLLNSCCHDTELYNESVFFTIDSVDGSIRNLRISGNGVCAYSAGNVNASFSFDSLPLTIPRPGVFEVPAALYSCIRSWNGMINSVISAGTDENGSGSGTDTTLISIGIKIFAPGVSGVSQSPATDFFSAQYDWVSDKIVLTLPLLRSSQSIAIFDLVGNEVLRTTALPGSKLIESPAPSLLPGCYFARLGDEVAKFIVPPR